MYIYKHVLNKFKSLLLFESNLNQRMVLGFSKLRISFYYFITLNINLIEIFYLLVKYPFETFVKVIKYITLFRLKFQN
jgi:hypothetical protein